MFCIMFDVTVASTSLHLHGNQLNYITTSWTVGYIIGQVPSKLVLFWSLFALSYSIQHANYACPTVGLGKLAIPKLLCSGSHGSQRRSQIPTMELIWGSLTMCLAASKDFSTLCAIRFFIGLAESTFFPAIQVCSWFHMMGVLTTANGNYST